MCVLSLRCGPRISGTWGEKRRKEGVWQTSKGKPVKCIRVSYLTLPVGLRESRAQLSGGDLVRVEGWLRGLDGLW